jgi:hypothetical protein
MLFIPVLFSNYFAMACDAVLASGTEQLVHSTSLRGRAVNSPPQFLQAPCIAVLHAAQNVHS